MGDGLGSSRHRRAVRRAPSSSGSRRTSTTSRDRRPTTRRPAGRGARGADQGARGLRGRGRDAPLRRRRARGRDRRRRRRSTDAGRSPISDTRRRRARHPARGHRGRDRRRASPRAGSATCLDQVARVSGGEHDGRRAGRRAAEAETGLDAARGRRDPARRVGGDRGRRRRRPGGSFVNSDAPEGLPVGVKIQGDPEEIQDVLDKLRAQMGDQSDVLVTESDGDMVAIGPNDDYRAELLEDGDLGDSDVFQNVVREADDASVDRLRQLRRRRRLAGQAGRRRRGGRGQPRAARRARHQRLDRGRRLARRAPADDQLTHAASVSGPADPVRDRPGDPDQVGRASSRSSPRRPAETKTVGVVERGLVDARSGAGASGRSARSRRRRTRSPARRPPGRPSRPCCRRARGPAP